MQKLIYYLNIDIFCYYDTILWLSEVSSFIITSSATIFHRKNPSRYLPTYKFFYISHLFLYFRGNLILREKNSDLKRDKVN